MKISQKKRERIMIKTSMIGIATNLFLSFFKAVIGLMSHSISVTLDALNNFSDALSSIITIIGTKLANKKPDREHPYGHGRYEYLTSIGIALLILYAGISALIESIKKIIHPQVSQYTWISVLVMIVAIITKIILGTYVKEKGNQVHSTSVIASGKDALFDAILTISVLISIILNMIFHIQIEAYVGIIISLFIIKAGYEIISEMISELLGARIGADITNKVLDVIRQDEDVLGAYDLILHNYGPRYLMGSVHVEVSDTMTARQIDTMTRRIMNSVASQTGVMMSAIGVYSSNTLDQQLESMNQQIRTVVSQYEEVLQMHGLYIDRDKKTITFDVVTDFGLENKELLKENITSQIQDKYPEYQVEVIVEHDYSDI